MRRRARAPPRLTSAPLRHLLCDGKRAQKTRRAADQADAVHAAAGHLRGHLRLGRRRRRGRRGRRRRRAGVHRRERRRRRPRRRSWRRGGRRARDERGVSWGGLFGAKWMPAGGVAVVVALGAGHLALKAQASTTHASLPVFFKKPTAPPARTSRARLTRRLSAPTASAPSCSCRRARPPSPPILRASRRCSSARLRVRTGLESGEREEREGG